MFSFIVNWFKMKLYDKDRDRDIFSTYELKRIFMYFIKQESGLQTEAEVLTKFVRFIVNALHPTGKATNLTDE